MIGVIATVSPDILLLQGIDHDHGLAALGALRDGLTRADMHYPHIFARQPNTGVPTGHDQDGDGRAWGDRDNHGFGEFAGQGGMAILSRYPIVTDDVQDFTGMLWRDLPDALLPVENGKPFPSAGAQAVLRLASVAHWVVPVRTESGVVSVMAFHNTPPVFDGPEDRNGRRNHDQLRFWKLYLDGMFGPAPKRRFVLLGHANLDPVDGEGRKAALHALLEDPRLQDAKPLRPGKPAQQPGHKADPRLDTVTWPRPDPGHKRVSYILPSADLNVINSSVHWPAGGEPAMQAARASRHRLIWADLEG